MTDPRSQDPRHERRENSLRENSLNASQTLSKTITGATVAALDTAYAGFVRGLTQEKIVEIRFAFISGEYAVCIIYTPT